jgi:hypothetical protein
MSIWSIVRDGADGLGERVGRAVLAGDTLGWVVIVGCDAVGDGFAGTDDP